MNIDQDYKLTPEEERNQMIELTRQLEERAEAMRLEELRESKEDDELCQKGPGNGVGKHYCQSSRKRYKQIRPYF